MSASRVQSARRLATLQAENAHLMSSLAEAHVVRDEAVQSRQDLQSKMANAVQEISQEAQWGLEQQSHRAAKVGSKLAGEQRVTQALKMKLEGMAHEREVERAGLRRRIQDLEGDVRVEVKQRKRLEAMREVDGGAAGYDGRAGESRRGAGRRRSRGRSRSSERRGGGGDGGGGGGGDIAGDFQDDESSIYPTDASEDEDEDEGRGQSGMGRGGRSAWDGDAEAEASHPDFAIVEGGDV